MSRPDLSVVVVTFNGREMALRTLRSARSACGPIDAEWIVADSGSTDGTPEVIEREFPEVRVLRCANLGFAHANNVALAAARGRYLLLLNPDVEIESGSLADLVAALDERPAVGAASVLQRGPDGRVLPSIRRFPTPARDLGEALFSVRWPRGRSLAELDTEFDRYDRERCADWFSGSFLVVRAEAAAQVGPLDERFFLYSEEVDWCYRIARAGWELRHLPIVEIVHHGGPNSPERVAELAHSRILFAAKHFGRLRARAIQATIVLNHALRVGVLAPAALFAPAPRRRLRAELFGLASAARLIRPPLSTRARAALGPPRQLHASPR